MRRQGMLVGGKEWNFLCWISYSNLGEGRFVSFPSGMVWNAWVPPKVSFFA